MRTLYFSVIFLAFAMPLGFTPEPILAGSFASKCVDVLKTILGKKNARLNPANSPSKLTTEGSHVHPLLPQILNPKRVSVSQLDTLLVDYKNSEPLMKSLVDQTLNIKDGEVNEEAFQKRSDPNTIYRGMWLTISGLKDVLSKGMVLNKAKFHRADQEQGIYFSHDLPEAIVSAFPKPAFDSLLRRSFGPQKGLAVLFQINPKALTELNHSYNTALVIKEDVPMENVEAVYVYDPVSQKFQQLEDSHLAR